MSIFGDSVEIDSSGRLLITRSCSDDESLEKVIIYDYKDTKWVKRSRSLFDKFIKWIGR